MEHAVSEIVPEGGKAAVNVSRLSAAMAISAGEDRPAIEAGADGGSFGLARVRLDRAGGDIARRFDSPRIHRRMMAEPGGRVECVRRLDPPLDFEGRGTT
jgi:hypothetical protein